MPLFKTSKTEHSETWKTEFLNIRRRSLCYLSERTRTKIIVLPAVSELLLAPSPKQVAKYNTHLLFHSTRTQTNQSHKHGDLRQPVRLLPIEPKRLN